MPDPADDLRDFMDDTGRVTVAPRDSRPIPGFPGYRAAADGHVYAPLTREAVDKPYCDPCYHYFAGHPIQLNYVGAVWRDDEEPRLWHAHCSVTQTYGHMGDFATEAEADAALRTRIDAKTV